MKSRFTWILDNGHGINTQGKRSLRLPDGRQFFEYRFNREIVSNMIFLLDRKGYNSYQLVPEEKDIPLTTRIERANWLALHKPCVLVSVHSNAYGDGKKFTVPRGIETFYAESSPGSRMLAEFFQDNLVQSLGWRDRGAKTASFAILQKTNMPAILTETGFYSNREQLEYLLDPDYRIMIAEAHVEAIEEIEEMGPAFFMKDGGRAA